VVAPLTVRHCESKETVNHRRLSVSYLSSTVLKQVHVSKFVVGSPVPRNRVSPEKVSGGWYIPSGEILLCEMNLPWGMNVCILQWNKLSPGDTFWTLMASVFAAMSDNFSVANYVTAYTTQLPRLLNWSRTRPRRRGRPRTRRTAWMDNIKTFQNDRGQRWKCVHGVDQGRPKNRTEQKPWLKWISTLFSKNIFGCDVVFFAI